MERTANVYPCVAFVDDVHDVLKLHVAHKWNVMSHKTHQHVRLVTLVLEEACPRLQFHVVAQVTVHEFQGLIDCHHDGVDISIGIRTGIHLVHPPEIRVGEGTAELSELCMYGSHLVVKDDQFHLVFEQVHHLFERTRLFQLEVKQDIAVFIDWLFHALLVDKLRQLQWCKCQEIVEKFMQHNYCVYNEEMYSLMNISGNPSVIFLSICKERQRQAIVPKASIDSCTKSFR